MKTIQEIEIEILKRWDDNEGYTVNDAIIDAVKERDQEWKDRVDNMIEEVSNMKLDSNTRDIRSYNRGIISAKEFLNYIKIK